MEFCKAFNAQSQQMEKGAPIPVVITIYADRSFTFEMKTPPVSHFLKKAAGLQAGLEDAGPRQGRRRDQGAGARDRGKEDEGPELQHGRSGHAHDRRFRPFHGP